MYIKNILILFLSFISYFLFPNYIHADWQKDSNNPVVSVNNSGCDAIHAMSPSVIFDEGVYKIWYQGLDQNSWNICYASSNDGISWSKQTSPVYHPVELQ